MVFDALRERKSLICDPRQKILLSELLEWGSYLYQKDKNICRLKQIQVDGSILEPYATFEVLQKVQGTKIYWEEFPWNGKWTCRDVPLIFKLWISYEVQFCVASVQDSMLHMLPLLWSLGHLLYKDIFGYNKGIWRYC